MHHRQQLRLVHKTKSRLAEEVRKLRQHNTQLELSLVKVRRQAEQFRAAFETALDAMIISDQEGTIHPDNRQKNDEEVARLAAGKLTVSFENSYILKDGSIRTITCRGPFLKKG